MIPTLGRTVLVRVPRVYRNRNGGQPDAPATIVSIGGPLLVATDGRDVGDVPAHLVSLRVLWNSAEPPAYFDQVALLADEQQAEDYLRGYLDRDVVVEPYAAWPLAELRDTAGRGH